MLALYGTANLIYHQGQYTAYEKTLKSLKTENNVRLGVTKVTEFKRELDVNFEENVMGMYSVLSGDIKELVNIGYDDKYIAKAIDIDLNKIKDFIEYIRTHQESLNVKNK